MSFLQILQPINTRLDINSVAEMTCVSQEKKRRLVFVPLSQSCDCKDNYLLHGSYTQHMVHNDVTTNIKYGWHTPNK